MGARHAGFFRRLRYRKKHEESGGGGAEDGRMRFKGEEELGSGVLILPRSYPQVDKQFNHTHMNSMYTL